MHDPTNTAGHAKEVHQGRTPVPPCNYGDGSSLSRIGLFNGPGFEKIDPVEAPRPIIDKYQLIDTLGVGGMGTVFRAHDRDISREVALKVPPNSSPRNRIRIIEEAQLAGQLEHPNIVPVHELGATADGNVYFTMKLVQGRTLKEIITLLSQSPQEHKREFSQTALLNIFVNICNGIAYAHDKGVIHRDIKPANIMIGSFGEVQVMDWGLAKKFGTKDEDDGITVVTEMEQSGTGKIHSIRDDTNLEITMKGSMIGTPAYMSPEQASGRLGEIDALSDIYSLGAILYEMLTHQKPALGTDLIELQANIICGNIQPPHEVRPSIPRELSAIIMKAMAKKKEERYPTALALRSDVQRFLEGRTVSAKHDSPGELALKFIKRNKILSYTISTILVVLVLALIVNIKERKSTEHAFSQYRAEQKAREALIAQDYYERQRIWVPVFSDDFSDTNISARWSFLYGSVTNTLSGRGLTMIPPPLHFYNGGVSISKGLPQCMIIKHPVRGDCAIEFDCRQDSAYRNDISVFINALSTVDSGQIPYSGYIFQFGGYDNTRIVLKNSQEATALYQEDGAPIKQGVNYHVRAERIGKRLLFMINHDTIIDVVDKLPLYGIDRSVIGIYGWKAHAWYDNVKVFVKGVPLKDDLLEVATRHLEQGDYETAYHLYTDIAAASVDPERRRDGRNGAERTEKLMHIAKSIPLYNAQLKKAWPQFKPNLEISEEGLTVNVSPGRSYIRDLTPLINIPIVTLSIANCTLITSLEPLSKLHLTSLTMNNASRVMDLSPLTKSKLTFLNISHSNVTNIAPLANMPLTMFEANYSKITNLSPFAGAKLEGVMINGCDISDISPLANMPISTFWAYGTDISDCSPLQGAPLRVCRLIGNRRISDISPLAKSPITELWLSHTQIQNFKPLSDMQLVTLYADWTPVADISPLQGMPLKNLYLSGTKIKSILALRGMELTNLSLEADTISDLSPLAGMPLFSLGLFGTPLDSSKIALVQSLPLRQLTIDVRDRRAAQCVKEMPNLLYVNSMVRTQTEIFMAVQDSATSPRNALSRFRKHAVKRGSAWYFLVPLYLTPAEAAHFADSLGGRLAKPTTNKQRSLLSTYVDPLCLFRTFIHADFRITQGDQNWTNKIQYALAKKTGYAVFEGAGSPNLLGIMPYERAYFVLEWDK